MAEDTKVSFTQQATLVVVSVILAMGGTWSMLKSGVIKSGPTTDDDAPIIITGGSLYIGTRADHTMESVPANTPTHLEFWNPPSVANTAGGAADKTRYVAQLDVVDDNDHLQHYPASPYTTATDLSLYVDYTYSSGGAPVTDTLTLKYDASTNGLRIDDSANKLPDVHRLMPNFLMHPRKGGVITRIASTWISTAPTCVVGECSVVIHTCKNGQTCTW